jgi:two-component system OmpR family response regulator
VITTILGPLPAPPVASVLASPPTRERGPSPALQPEAAHDWIDLIQAKRLRILVVDDGDAFRESLAFKLRNVYGAVVEEAGGGAEALRKMSGGESPFDLVLLDVAMPDIDGLQVCRTLLEQRVEARIVLMSAYFDAESQARTRSLGVSLLDKPLEDEVLEGILLACGPGQGS